MVVPIRTTNMSRSAGETLQGVQFVANSILRYFEFCFSIVLTCLNTRPVAVAVAVVSGVFLTICFPVLLRGLFE
jgi:hypothetical protein